MLKMIKIPTWIGQFKIISRPLLVTRLSHCGQLWHDDDKDFLNKMTSGKSCLRLFQRKLTFWAKKFMGKRAFLFYGPIPASFLFVFIFVLFTLKLKLYFKIWSVGVVLGIRTLDRRVVCADGSTELWRLP